MMNKRKILIFSGAGVSAESGIATFRSSKDSLWNNHRVEDVASVSGWNKDPQSVLDFYNHRRAECILAKPNNGHYVIKQLEDNYDVTIATQNVDDLHERAGSTNILHLHGELLKSRSLNNNVIEECLVDLTIADNKRPHIVWFGEELDTDILNAAKAAADDVDVCIIVGTSMKVWPANILPFLTKHTCLIYYVDPSDIDFNIPTHRKPYFYHIQKPASTGMIDVMNDIDDIFNNKYNG